MRLAVAALATLCLAASAIAQQASAPAAPIFDASLPLDSRVGGEVPASVVKIYAAQGPIKTYTPTAEEKHKVIAALALLTPLQRQIAQNHLRTIVFAEGLPSNGMIMRVLEQQPSGTFDIIFNAAILKETASEFLTRKERQLFDVTGSTLTVSIDAGSMDAVAFVLLHEATHLVDMTLKITPQNVFRALSDEAQTSFTRGVWEERSRLAPPYHDPIFDRVAFAPDARTIPVAEAKSLYEALGRTPAVSIYATRTFAEDLAETVAWRQMERLGQPYRIELRDKAKDGGKVIYAYEPLKNPLLRGRFAQLSIFDSPAAN
jgi:hypothetical protein